MQSTLRLNIVIRKGHVPGTRNQTRIALCIPYCMAKLSELKLTGMSLGLRCCALGKLWLASQNYWVGDQREMVMSKRSGWLRVVKHEI
jgi:hypothetical protein